MSSNGETSDITLARLALIYRDVGSIPYGDEPAFRRPIARYIRGLRQAERSGHENHIDPLIRATVEELVSVGFVEYQEKLRRFAVKRIGTGHDDPQDIIQEAFMRVYANMERFDLSRRFSSWVYTIAGNLCKNELRRRDRAPITYFEALTRNMEPADRSLQWESYTGRPDDLFRKRELRALVEQVLEELPDHHRQAFRLRELEGKSYAEIADITGKDLGTVKSRLHRARATFARRIEPYL